ncbi:MAG TPA: GNAT family N-acetyltransferase [Flavihumibacter sp.]|jgi:GNAT superfamily N-acetyltransferase
MSDALVIRSADQDDIPTIGFLAHTIWPVVYSEIISPEQIDYMLTMMYSPDSLLHQIEEQGHQFILAEVDQEEVGFASYGKVDGAVWKLHKLYVLPSMHGKGVGRALLDMVEEEVRTQNGAHLILNVNKRNKAVQFYTSMGFEIEREAVLDIGNGYVMDDYVMGKDV